MATRASGRHLSTSRPIFVLTLPRSGSTLLRYLLDAHSEVACPPETQLSSLCASVLESWLNYRSPDDFETRKRRGIAQARAAARQLMIWHLERDQKSLFCEKSLPNVDNAPMLSEVFPGARFICLYRHPMDFVASARESCKWGFANYGLYPYAASSVNNFVLALTRAWCEKTSAVLSMEQEHPERCVRVTYESLVRDPHDQFRRICEFLGVSDEPTVVDTAIGKAHIFGHGDHKIRTTEAVNTDSLGRGASVPVGLIPPAGLTNLNNLAKAVGYEAIDEGFNSRPSVLRLGLLTISQQKALSVAIECALCEVASQAPTEWPPLVVRLLIEEFSTPRGWLLDLDQRILRDDDPDKRSDVTLIMRAQALVALRYGLSSLSAVLDGGDLRIGDVEKEGMGVDVARWFVRALFEASSDVPSMALLNATE